MHKGVLILEGRWAVFRGGNWDRVWRVILISVRGIPEGISRSVSPVVFYPFHQGGQYSNHSHFALFYCNLKGINVSILVIM